MLKTAFQFIIIDDNAVNNMLSGIFINEVVSEAIIKDFETAETGLDYILQEYSSKTIPTILFLDINMPTMSGWEFLDKFDTLDKSVKDQFCIYLMSSSVDPGDKRKASENKNVVDYIEKPLSEETVLLILEAQQ